MNCYFSEMKWPYKSVNILLTLATLRFLRLHMDILLSIRYIGQEDPLDYRDRNPIKISSDNKNNNKQQKNHGKYIGSYIHNWEDETNI